MLLFVVCYFFFFKQKTAYEMRISDWSSDVCSSDLAFRRPPGLLASAPPAIRIGSEGARTDHSVRHQNQRNPQCDMVRVRLGQRVVDHPERADENARRAPCSAIQFCRRTAPGDRCNFQSTTRRICVRGAKAWLPAFDRIDEIGRAH